MNIASRGKGQVMWGFGSNRDSSRARVRHCFECGAEITPDARACLVCGTAVDKVRDAFWFGYALVAVALVGAVALMVFLTWKQR